MVKRARTKSAKQARDAKMQARKRVLYFPNQDLNEEIARVAAEDGFVHEVPGKAGEQPNVAAYFVWLHRQHMLRRKRESEQAA
jgi:ribosomal protein S8